MPGFEVIDEKEKNAVCEVFDEGGVLFAHGFDNLRKKYHVREFEKEMRTKTGSKYCHAVSSGTAAIKCALKAIGISEGDEIITQGFNFVATVEAIHDCGAKTIICNIDEELNIDLEDVKKLTSEKTKCIIAVNMLGIAGRLEELKYWCNENGIFLIEDACESVGGITEMGYMGTLGDIGIYSFDHGKNLTCGEGGMILTNNKKLYEFVRSYSDHGHELKEGINRGEDAALMAGFNYRMTELQAAVGKVQLSKLDEIILSNKERYEKIAGILSQKYEIRKPIKENDEQSYDTLIIKDLSDKQKDKVIEIMQKNGIGTKNLPDAMKWHCSYYWDHILTEIEIKKSKKIESRLSNCVAIPILISKSVQYYEGLGELLVGY